VVPSEICAEAAIGTTTANSPAANRASGERTRLHHRFFTTRFSGK
jgi:hypothetical protein